MRFEISWTSTRKALDRSAAWRWLKTSEKSYLCNRFTKCLAHFINFSDICEKSQIFLKCICINTMAIFWSLQSSPRSRTVKIIWNICSFPRMRLVSEWLTINKMFGPHIHPFLMIGRVLGFTVFQTNRIFEWMDEWRMAMSRWMDESL